MRHLLEIKNFLTKSQVMNWAKASPVHPKNRGIPTPTKRMSEGCSSCQTCESVCPVTAIKIESSEKIRIDYGSCIQCGECVLHCPDEKLINSGFIYVFSKHRSSLSISYMKGDFVPEAKIPDTENHIRFEKLTKTNGFLYREVAAAGNNSADCELNASFNSVFDSEREGVRNVASPKHADAIVYTGPISVNMAGPLADAFEVIAEPKALIACGSEAINGGLFPLGTRPKEPDLFIAGDPPRPDVAIQAFRYLMGRFSFSFQEALHKFLQSSK
ncbi:4Fe-4S dicluster domain-containing protein [Leptospira ognonensis]|uniref:4Fe-4S dicluster domain-containing protein n=1 Tax=Leptospira ognonensis TaxID=2484945 RepID=A0A4R9K1G1_9LEPT|nr:4Fe-4S dicluster domain-containing protein [Leptospira ognonensis]TGL57945.1 4Fe-4S dicluster domain-containing protein [Leptospira ognonensis]